MATIKENELSSQSPNAEIPQHEIYHKELGSIYGDSFSLVEAKTRCLLTSHQQLEHICKILENECKRGLHRDTNLMADIKMLPTHITDQPASYPTLGHFAEPDEGKFLALDLGGTNFRVVLVELEGNNFHMESDSYALSQDLMRGPGSQLFDYIADCLHTFVVRHRVDSHRLPLGFTFSFPCEQESLSHARLVAWTKGFTCSGVEGKDVCKLLHEAIRRRSDLDIEVMAVLNDTVGTLVSCAYQNKECRLGLIVGTGTNACYMERVDDVHRMHQGKEYRSDPNKPHHEHEMTVVNTEWGAFGDNGTLDFIRTIWDQQIDLESAEVGRQRFEKMIGGLYIGEICRRVIADMALDKHLMFNEQCNDVSRAMNHRKIMVGGNLSKPFAFPSKYVSMVESDQIDQYENTRQALKEAFGIDWASDQDCASVKLICSRVSTRAAHLVAAAVGCLLNKMARPNTVVGVDGSMFRYHPHFRSIMAKKTRELTHPPFGFQLMFSEDGSGRGAAIVAAVACRKRRLSMQVDGSNQQVKTCA